MTETLVEKICTPCRGGVPALTQEEAQGLQMQVSSWTLLDGAHGIERSFRFPNFREALAFVQRAGELAEAEGHHPDVRFGWGYATVSLRAFATKLNNKVAVLPFNPQDQRRKLPSSLAGIGVPSRCFAMA